MVRRIPVKIFEEEIRSELSDLRVEDERNRRRACLKSSAQRDSEKTQPSGKDPLLRDALDLKSVVAFRALFFAHDIHVGIFLDDK